MLLTVARRAPHPIKVDPFVFVSFHQPAFVSPSKEQFIELTSMLDKFKNFTILVYKILRMQSYGLLVSRENVQAAQPLTRAHLMAQSSGSPMEIPA